MIVAIGQLIIFAVAAIALPFVSGGGAAIVTVIIAELLGALLGVNQFFDFIKKGSAVKFLCWAGALVDLIVSFALFSTKQSAGIALLIAFIGFPIGWLVVVLLYNMISKTGDTLLDVKDFFKDNHNPFVKEKKKSVYFCKKCEQVLFGDKGSGMNCPYCSNAATETSKTLYEWKELSGLNQQFLKSDFKEGKYLLEQNMETAIQQQGPQKEEEKTAKKITKKTAKKKTDATSQKEVSSGGTIFCRKCGAKIPADSAFCPKCGERVIK